MHLIEIFHEKTSLNRYIWPRGIKIHFIFSFIHKIYIHIRREGITIFCGKNFNNFFAIFGENKHFIFGIKSLFFFGQLKSGLFYF